MQALMEIIYALPKDGEPVETGRVGVGTEWWEQRNGRTFLRGLFGKVNEWTDITDRIAGSPPKFALVPIEEARSLEVFHSQALRLIYRSASLWTALKRWTMGHWSLCDALRCGIWHMLVCIHNIEKESPVRIERLSFDGGDSIEAWLGRAGAVELVYQDSIRRWSTWNDLFGVSSVSYSMSIEGEKTKTEVG